MAAQSFSIEFNGYWRESNKWSVPARSGIYCVYTCVRNVQEGTLSLKKLVYIGEADHVRNRISNHEKQDDWKSYLNKGEELCFSFGSIDSTYRERCEAALIFKHKPPENTEYVNSFPFDQTTLVLAGKTQFLVTSFAAERI